MDFYKIKERSAKNGVIEIYPDFVVGRSKDLMVRGRAFYAIWNEQAGLWSTDEYDVQALVDADLRRYKDEVSSRNEGVVKVLYMQDFSSGVWIKFRNYLNNVSDSSHQLDEHLTFSNTEVKKSDYVSRRLPYPLEEGPCAAWDEIVGTLYKPDERAKLEWAIGAIVAGDAKDIQKFIVLYGEAGAGKSTILNIIQKLFVGYYTTFEAKALTSSSNAFSTEVFKANPLVAIQHDGDLSKIEDNTKLNSIISHEDMTMNEKYKPSYMSKINAFLFMATNRPVKITDAKSGIIRRLIDVKPSGERLSPTRYHALMAQVDFELGAIAHHCLGVYRQMGRDYYSSYRPVEMMLQTDVFYNYIETYFHLFKEQDGVSLSQAFELFKNYREEAQIEYGIPKYKFREELKNYFGTFHEVTRIDGRQVRSYYSDFLAGKFLTSERVEEHPYSLVMDETESLLDEVLADCFAQYANSNETPVRRWAEVKTKLADLNTRELHYVKPPENHIVIDFDLRGEDGEKSPEKNLEAASRWPSTYAERSKGGSGIHLHYLYTGDVSELSRIFDEGIEIKVFSGDSSLRRKLSKCNNVPIATLSSGLPLREKRVLNQETLQSERSLRSLIMRNLNKEIHPGTKPSVDFIHKILEDAYSSGLVYDLTDLRPRIMAFANNSTNQAAYCLKLVSTMKFKSEEVNESNLDYDDRPLVFFDVEVYPNLFICSYKIAGAHRNVVRLVNPTPQQIEEVMTLKLVGFNCRRYDNHILYARLMGYNNHQLFLLSQRLISNSPNAYFSEAFNVSYADIYEYASKKQSLKRWQIELGLNHKEIGLPWDQPVPDDMIDAVGEYCDNDVITTEQVHDAREEDFVARHILAELSGLSVNDTTQKHAAKIIFGNDKRPQEKFVYTDLSEMFPGYRYEYGKSVYRDEDPSEGGYVYSEPGMYTEVALLDVASMHPTSIINLNLFGDEYTQRFKDIVQARLAIKYKDYTTAREMFDGRLTPYLENEMKADDLAYALKIIINIIYGMTSAKFDNPFKDPRNVDNIVAKRGALFMIDLKHAVQERGFTVAHIKTDSIKIPNATPEIIEFVKEFGERYGYSFDHETTYEKLCLVNDAVYAAKTRTELGGTRWVTVGAQFQHPYVYKTLFTKEPIELDDVCETRTVTTALYLDLNENLGPDEHNYHFVGRAGRFIPVVEGANGGWLLREKDGEYHSAAGSKGYRWLEAVTVTELDKTDKVDFSYFEKLVNEAVDKISKFGDFEWFVSND